MSETGQRDSLSEHFEKNKERFFKEWSDFLRFPSVSTDPSHFDDCVSCAQWLSAHLESIGFKTELIPTPNKPLVYAVYEPKEVKGPSVLFYGHYDVQPTDPVDAWKSPPFEPAVRNGRLYARGAQDNKGQVFYVLKALETLIQSGNLHCPVRLIIEGEEEDGSKGITEVLPSLQVRLQSDILLVCDTGTLAPECATITMGLRGLITMELRLSGAAHDLHSGVYGGVVKNPASEMARLINSLHDADGKIAVEGYLDGVAPISDADRKIAHTLPISIDMLEQMIGVKLNGGEKSFSPIERRGFRPTIEVNGLHSGYGGPGTKTIIPSYAIAKLTSRLVGGQDPKKCLELLEVHVRKHAPEGLKLDVSGKGVGGPALLLSSASPLIQTAKTVLDQIAPKGTCLMWEGASIPVIPALAQTSGAEPLLVGFGLEEDCIHAPNESFALEQFKRGFLYISMLLSNLSSGR